MRPVRHLILSLCVPGCFGAPPVLAHVADETTANVASSGHTSTEGDEANDDASSPTSTPPPTSDDAVGTATGGSDGEDTTTGAGSTMAESGCVGCQAFGEPCDDHQDCASEMCFPPQPGESTVCTAACNPADGGCSAVGHASFCNQITTDEYACFGELDTGTDDEDAMIFADGPPYYATLGNGDVDAIYLRFDRPGNLELYVDPTNPSLDIIVTLYYQGELLDSQSKNGPGQPEIKPFEISGDTFPGFALVVVSASPGAAGGYSATLSTQQ